MRRLWPTTKITDVLTERREAPSAEDLALGRVRIVSKIAFDTGRIELRTEGGTNTGMILAQPGDLLISGINAAKGAIAIYGPENEAPIAATIHYGAYTPKHDRADLKFLWWFFRSRFFRSLLAEKLPGGIKTELKSKRLLPISIPLPPLAEQRLVVARIEELAAKVCEARDLRHAAAADADVLVGARASSIFRAAMNNGSVPLESLALLERGKFQHRPRNEPRFFGGNHPWIQIGEIESSQKYIRTWTQTLNDGGLAISKKFRRGTVLVSIAATIGAVGILDFDCCVPDSIVGVTPKPGCDSEFVFHYLSYLRGHLQDIAPQNAQKNINLRILSELPVPTVALAEQRRIVAELDLLQAQVNALKQQQAETAAELDALLPAILDRALKGEIV